VPEVGLESKPPVLTSERGPLYHGSPGVPTPPDVDGVDPSDPVGAQLGHTPTQASAEGELRKLAAGLGTDDADRLLERVAATDDSRALRDLLIRIGAEVVLRGERG
jgi:hypothetical protein